MFRRSRLTLAIDIYSVGLSPQGRLSDFLEPTDLKGGLMAKTIFMTTLAAAIAAFRGPLRRFEGSDCTDFVGKGSLTYAFVRDRLFNLSAQGSQRGVSRSG